MMDAAGHVGKAVPAGRIIVPGSITLDGDQVLWKITEKTHLVEPNRSMLNDFVQLWDKPPANVRAFAKKWGVLAIGQHNRPGAVGIVGQELIEAWRYYSRRAMAVLNLIASIKQEKIGGVEDWRQLGTGDDSPEEWERVGNVAAKFPLPSFTGFPATVREASTIIANEVNAWMAVWRAHRADDASDFRVDATGAARWEMQVDFHGCLFPALAFQLCLVAVNADSLYCCSGCGFPYVRPREGKGSRRPKPGQDNYCKECVRLGIPVRRASERYRERKANVQTKTRKR
jgi:hypothetical protein